MTPTQILIISILSLLAIVFYFGSTFSKKYNSEHSTGLFILYAIMTTTVIVTMAEMNRLRKISKGKYPEYEKVENVYRLKE